MRLHILTLPALAVSALIAVSSCRKEPETSGTAGSGLRGNTTYRCNAVEHDGPMRMFTTAGEVTDAGVIADYQLRYAIFGDSSPVVRQYPDNLFSTFSEIVYYNGLVPYQTRVAGDVIIMRQQDTGMTGHGTPGNSIDFLFNTEREFLAMREQMLDMRESYTKLERVDDENYRIRESFHVQGEYSGQAVRLPYTFMANRIRWGSYPFALKRGVAPKVPAGDTLLVREGRVSFR